MNRTTLLQDRRMEKFEELLKRWHDGGLSGAEAREFWAVQSGSSPATGGATRKMGWTA